MARIKESAKQQRRALIIEAAVKVFAEKGFFGAKVTDVAKEAKVADGTIYLYFKNKDDLLISLFESKMELFLQRFARDLSEIDSPLEKLQTFIYSHFSFIEEDKNLADVFQVELRQSTKFLKDYHNQKFIDYLDIIAGILREGQDKKIFRQDINIEITRLMIFGAIDEIARQWILGADSKYDLETARDQLVQTIINGLVKK